MGITPELKEKLEKILFRLVKAQVQENNDSLPCAASENRQLAIVSLSKLLPDFKFEDQDYQKELEDIFEFAQLFPKVIYDNL